MKESNKVVKVVIVCLIFLPIIIGALAESSKKKTTPSYECHTSPSKPAYQHVPPINPILQKTLEDIKNNPPATYQKPSRPQQTYSPTPDDAYEEGYENGYEQGFYDGKKGLSHGYNYDDESDYYNYYETRYQEGYEDGYEDGYADGNSVYEEEDEDW